VFTFQLLLSLLMTLLRSVNFSSLILLIFVLGIDCLYGHLSTYVFHIPMHWKNQTSYNADHPPSVGNTFLFGVSKCKL